MRGTQVDDRRSQSRPRRTLDERREIFNLYVNVAVELPLSPVRRGEGLRVGRRH
jgi:hypothetical protein